jgi:hypothetical protein
MSRNGSGTYNLPAGNPVTTGTTIQSSWANSTLSDIGAALTQSLSRDGQAAMTGPLPMGGQDIANAGNITANANVNGAAFIPTGATVPTNGMYLSTANTVAWATATTQRATVNGTGNWIISAASSGTTFTVAAASGVGTIASINSNSANGGVATFFDIVNGATRGYIGHGSNAFSGAAIGDFGIAATSGTVRISSNSGVTTNLSITNAGNVTIAAPTSGYHLITGLAATNGTVLTNASGSICLFVGGQGSTNNPRVQFTYNEAGNSCDINANASVTNPSWSLSTNSAAVISISANRNVTIAAPISGTTLTVNGVANSNVLIVNMAANSNQAALGVNGASGQTAVSATFSSSVSTVAPVGLFPATTAAPCIQLQGATNVGANTLTPTWTNFLGTGGTKNPGTWLTVVLQNGSTLGWIPVFT